MIWELFKKPEHGSHIMEKIGAGSENAKIFGRSSDIFEEIDHKVHCTLWF